MSIEKDIYLHAIYTSYDSLIQRARNSLVRIALEQNFDDLVFVDSDVEWDPQWLFNLLDNPEPVVGGALVRKSDKTEGYTVKMTKKEIVYNSRGNLIEVDGIGTGFLKMSRFALQKLWDISPIYRSDDGEENRMIFDVVIQNEELISEDYIACKKWQDLGYKVWLDPTITCKHIGNKKYEGNFEQFLVKNGYTK
jgi:choline kinase